MQRAALLCCGIFIILTGFPSIRSYGAPAPSPMPEVSPPPAAVVSPENPGAFDPAAATTAWLETVPADRRAKSDAYFEGGYWLILWNCLEAVAITLLLLHFRLSARIRDWAERLTNFKALQVVLYSLVFLLAVSLLAFPLQVYQGFFREHQYGLATQTFGPWFAERMMDMVVSLIAVPILLVVLYAVFRRASNTWWLWATIVVTFFQVFAAFIAPIYIEPLYNKYKPLEDAAIRDPILTMARANQIPVQQVLVVDASRQTTRISANVAGAFNTTRIALNDNLLNQCSLPEIRAVMAHEMGHYVLNHLTKLVVFQSGLFLLMFAITAVAFNAATRRWGARWGVRGIGDIAGLPLLLLIFNVLMFVLTPALNTIGRTTEAEADAFGINTAREPDGMAKIALKLGAYRKLNPGPLEEVIFFDHPSGRARIRMAMDWKGAQLTCGEVKK